MPIRGLMAKFNPDFYFHWADLNNDPVNDWKVVAETPIIPFQWHINWFGFYTVADDSDGVLKVMRSYQYYASNKISDRVSKMIGTKEISVGLYLAYHGFR